MYHFFIIIVLSYVRLFVMLWTVVCQAPVSMGFPRQAYWSGLPFPPPVNLLDPGIKPNLLHLLHWQVGSLPFCHLSLCTKSLVFTYLKVLVHRLCPNPYSPYTLPLENTSLITLSMNLFVSFWRVNDLQLLLVPIIKHSDFVLYISKWSQ